MRTRSWNESRPRLVLGLLLAALPLPAQAQDNPSPWADLRGLIELRDEHLLAQGRLTLPPASPLTVGAGKTRVRVFVQWANSFGWTQDVSGEMPADRRFLIDGEARTFEANLTRGLGQSFDLSLRVPVRWRGGGVLDGFIDAWHRTFAFIGVPDGGRPDFRKNAFRVEGQTIERRAFSWNDHTGTGLGNVEIATRWNVSGPQADRSTTAILARVSLPTAGGPYERTAGAGLQLLNARRLGKEWSLHLGAGATVEGSSFVRGIRYEKARGHTFAGIEWRPWKRLSLMAETDAATRLVQDIDLYPSVHWMLNGGLKLAVSEHTILEVGIVENLKDQSSTTDFAMVFGIEVRR